MDLNEIIHSVSFYAIVLNTAYICPDIHFSYDISFFHIQYATKAL